MGLWLAGGLVMLIGAMCYAELGSTYPDSGGESNFLVRAWGAPVGLTVSGSTAAVSPVAAWQGRCW
ncbi:hypothetical protein CKA81_03675 [Pollutimonas thiosulfatoxidans]|uniref:Uncharacterized protein n=2 Tax=Pollutimonas thiosulfatoxidans TaxID=2028345 RepID=A0A410G9P8_9BURK|nr:hypothetical protein CKA81_03675 [Pollutimonas thiosulfatoxidans]